MSSYGTVTSPNGVKGTIYSAPCKCSVTVNWPAGGGIYTYKRADYTGPRPCSAKRHHYPSVAEARYWSERAEELIQEDRRRTLHSQAPPRIKDGDTRTND